MKKFNLANKEETERFFKRAGDWVESKGPTFSDVKRVSTLVLAEYLANLNGKTIYKHYAKDNKYGEE